MFSNSVDMLIKERGGGEGERRKWGIGRGETLPHE